MNFSRHVYLNFRVHEFISFRHSNFILMLYCSTRFVVAFFSKFLILMRLHINLKILIFLLFSLVLAVKAQETNPVERQVANPITDTPNVNPVSPEQIFKAPKRPQDSGYKPEGGDDEVVVYSEKQSVEGEDGKTHRHALGKC